MDVARLIEDDVQYLLVEAAFYQEEMSHHIVVLSNTVSTIHTLFISTWSPRGLSEHNVAANVLKSIYSLHRVKLANEQPNSWVPDKVKLRGLFRARAHAPLVDDRPVLRQHGHQVSRH